MGAGVEWTDTTDIVSGNAGTGLYLLWASSRGNAAARDLALRAGRRLMEREYRTGDASLWMMTPSFTRNMPNFSHGTGGVAYFLATLAGETRDKPLLDGALRGARYLQSVAVPTAGDGRRIFHNDPDGRELFYRTMDNRIMMEPYSAKDDSFVAGKSQLWSEARITGLGASINFDVAPDGKRLAVLMAPENAGASRPTHVTFLLNFFDELRRKAPLN